MKILLPETLDLIKESSYNLVIDEELAAVNPIAIGKATRKALLGSLTSTDEIGRVTWTGPVPTVREKVLYSIYKDTLVGSIVVTDKDLLIWEYPPDFISCFWSITILTYNFEGSIMSAYLDYHGFEYVVEEESHQCQKHLLKIVDSKAMNKVGDNPRALSSSRQKNFRAGVGSCATLTKNLNNFFRSDTYGKAELNERLVSCLKSAEGSLKGDSSGGGRGFGFRDAFQPHNLKAINTLGHVKKMAYVYNSYLHPDIIRLFDERGIKIDKDVFALNELLQWIYRSQIRNDKPINLYIPSSRMRGLLQDWLDKDHSQQT